MKKINSIDYGGKVLGTGLIFAVVVPLLLKLINFAVKSSFLNICMRCSIGVGCIIVILFFIYLGIELRQDKKIDQNFMTYRKGRTPIGEGLYECEACGNRFVREQDISCRVCGIRFEQTREKTVQEILKD